MPKRPYVLVNMAVTADGKIDTVDRRGARISGNEDGRRVDRLRAGSDAILVGGRTLLREDPRLTVRDPELVAGRVSEGRTAQPAKVGVVSRIGTPGGPDALPQPSRFLGEGGGSVFVCTTARTDARTISWLEALGAHVIVHEGDRVDLIEALAALAELGLGRLMVEGGSTIVAALLANGAVDEIQLAIAPLIFGGETAPTPVGGVGWAADAPVRVSLAEATPNTDGDVVLRYHVLGGTGR